MNRFLQPEKDCGSMTLVPLPRGEALWKNGSWEERLTGRMGF
jgi:hypothetical protein